MNEGNNEAIYIIGIEDDGNRLGITLVDLKESIYNIEKMAKHVNCNITIKSIKQGIYGYILELHLQRIHKKRIHPIQVHIALAGDFECGKSTLIGVLSSGKQCELYLTYYIC